MRRQHPRVLLGAAQVMQQLRETLDVGEEEADSARRQVAHQNKDCASLFQTPACDEAACDYESARSG
jgi:hypothetical protein